MIHHALKPAVLSWFADHPGKHSFNVIWEALERPPREHLRDTLRSHTKSKRLIQHGSREWEMKAAAATTEKSNGQQGALDRGALFGAFKQLDGTATKTQLRKVLHQDPSALLAEVEAEGLIAGQYGLYVVVDRAALGLPIPSPLPGVRPVTKTEEKPRTKTDPWTINPFEPDSIRGQTVEALRIARPGTLTTAGVIQLVGCEKGSASANLNALAKAGFAKKLGGGLWEAAVPEDPVREGTVRSRVLCATAMGEDFSFTELMARLGGDLDPDNTHRQFFAGAQLADKIPELVHLGDDRFHRKSEADLRAEQVARETPRIEERKAIAAAAKPPELSPPPPVVERRPVEVSHSLKVEPKPVKQSSADPLQKVTDDLKAQLEERVKAMGQLAEALTILLGDAHRLEGAVRSLDPSYRPHAVGTAWDPLVSAIEKLRT